MNLLLIIPMNAFMDPWNICPSIYVILLGILKHYINDTRQHCYSVIAFSFIIVCSLGHSSGFLFFFCYYKQCCKYLLFMFKIILRMRWNLTFFLSHIDSQLSYYQLLDSASFFSTDLSKIKLPHRHWHISKLSILFHWSIYFSPSQN